MDNTVTDNPGENSNTIKVRDSQQLDGKDDRFIRESQFFLSLFPKEIWIFICSFLDTRDLQNLINSSLFFRELFLHKRFFLLFESVMKIFLPRLDSYTSITTRDHQDLSSRSVFYNCRLTCKLWKITIEKLSCVWNKEKDKTTVYKYLAPRFSFRESFEIDKFLEHYKNTHHSNINPFPGKYIKLQVRLVREEFPTLFERISTLLKKYGHHLSTCLISVFFYDTNPPEIHQNVVDWLSCMPNLQNLSIQYMFPLRSTMDEVQLNIVPSKLKFLKNLVVKTYSPSLEDEHIQNWSWLKSYNLSHLLDQHENLNFLQIILFNKKDVEIFEKVTSPLKRLALEFNCKEDDVKLSEVFTMLSEKFSDSLEDLEMTFRVSNKPSGHMKIMRDSFNGRLNLPKVEKMAIRIMSMYSIDFLLGMQENLEDLTITSLSGRQGHFGYSRFSSEEREEFESFDKKQVIQYLGYQDRMLESNIWSLFPNLKKISLETFLGRRQEFRRRDWVKVQRLNSL